MRKKVANFWVKILHSKNDKKRQKKRIFQKCPKLFGDFGNNSENFLKMSGADFTIHVNRLNVSNKYFGFFQKINNFLDFFRIYSNKTYKPTPHYQITF
jgi:hypothetical protein